MFLSISSILIETFFLQTVYWYEFKKCYPDAKVILTVRDYEKMYESTKWMFENVIFTKWFTAFAKFGAGAAYVQRYFGYDLKRHGITDMQTEWTKEKAIQNYKDDIQFAKDVFRNNPQDLLIFSVNDGWAKLCNFVNKEIPDEPFPHGNGRQQWLHDVLSMFAQTVTIYSTKFCIIIACSILVILIGISPITLF